MLQGAEPGWEPFQGWQPVCAWPCVDSAQLLQPTVVMALPSGLVCASSSWPLVAFARPCGAHCSVAVGSHAMPYKCQTRLGVRCPLWILKAGGTVWFCGPTSLGEAGQCQRGISGGVII